MCELESADYHFLVLLISRQWNSIYIYFFFKYFFNTCMLWSVVYHNGDWHIWALKECQLIHSVSKFTAEWGSLIFFKLAPTDLKMSYRSTNN